MKIFLFPCLGAFVAGVFVGAGLWFALIVCAAVVVAWHCWLNPSPPDRSSVKHLTHFGPRRRGGGH
ncbi:hypothetical protein [Rariglobus hedericola]|uniref:Uncharacterized protein n=1 Tax=Rariglobus hedericola TaxID=2597822 RepID=A0A556QJF1_9BACT|nr:hypothetical protein [Rariglobus hedericola]TSJ76747.1 hypothetical protein FPL22_11520 [Rariglobus hedericola]